MPDPAPEIRKQKPWLANESGTVSGSIGAKAPASARPTGARRPVGITVIALFNYVVAALFLVLLVLYFSGASDRDLALVWVAILPMVISLGLGFALWRMMPWARHTAIVLYLVYAASALLNLFSREISLAGVAGVLIPAAIVVYLLQPSVGKAFEQPQY
jgi:hypothetical protein